MTRATVAIVPLDDRSVNYECLSMLGEAAGLEVHLPPKAWLGTPWRAGKTEELGAWVEEQAAGADALVVAVDTLGYGGLVNSRRSADSVRTVMARLDVLRRINREQGVTVVFIEQNVELALSIAHRGYVLESGRLLLGGPADALRTSNEVRRVFLGL